jgi:hypothetical protein
VQNATGLLPGTIGGIIAGYAATFSVAIVASSSTLAALRFP